MIKAIVTDIEGTTSAIAFVKEVLFPYAAAQMGDFVRAHAQDSVVSSLLQAVQACVGQALDTEQVIAQLLAWMAEDSKITPLKSLQGLIWQDGYLQGQLQGHLYPDVWPKLQAWHARGIALYVYSSGSIAAQKLLFGHTTHGDLTPLFSGYFDTHIGAKQDANSYARIAQQLKLAPAEILFLSDSQAELDAAHSVGFNTCQLCREGMPSQVNNHRQVNDFYAINV